MTRATASSAPLGVRDNPGHGERRPIDMSTYEETRSPRLQAEDDQIIMIVRHGEKPQPSGPVHGVTTSGRHDRRSLTPDGWRRAGGLAELLAPINGAPVAGLRKPDAVYGAAGRHGRSRRSVQTVIPLAERLGVEVVDRYAPGEEKKLVRELVTRQGTTAVSWHHNTIPKIVKHLGTVTPAPPEHWPDDRFDVVWKFTRRGSGWQFEQIPELLLPGDQPDPIPTEHLSSPAPVQPVFAHQR